MEFEVTVHMKAKYQINTIWLPDYESVDPDDPILDQVKAMLEEDVESGDFNIDPRTVKITKITTKAEIPDE